jgi:hypothetical protein
LRCLPRERVFRRTGTNHPRTEFKPDTDGETKASEETLPDTSLHAYKEGRKKDVSGDADGVESSDRDKHQGGPHGEGELPLPHPKA